MKKTIRLSESDLHRMVMETVHDLLKLDNNSSTEILSMAKSAEKELVNLNQKAVEYDLYELARDSAKLTEMIRGIISRIEASM